MIIRISTITLSVLLAGCISTTQPKPVCPPVVKTVPVDTTIAQEKSTPPEAVHLARYTLVSLSSDDNLRFPLHQITTHSLPVSPAHHRLTREEALHRWLKGTGYGLCLAITTPAKLFYGSPLPDAQRRMGPVRTERALQIIAGSAWVMTVDEVSRTVCWLPSPAIRSLN